MGGNHLHLHTQGLFGGGSTPGPLETALASILTNLATAAGPVLTEIVKVGEPLLLAWLTSMLPAAATAKSK